MIDVKDDKMTELRAFMERMKKEPHSEAQLIAILHKAQGLYGYLGREVMDAVSEAMNIPTAHIWGVATFYHYFNLKPKGKHSISVCLGTACFVKGAAQILDAIRNELKIDIGDTTPDGFFTLQETRCLGTCGLAPVMMVDDKVYGGLTPKKALDALAEIRKKG
jgi:NADH-quinone oxidoreductase subunit E/NADP-reducing hydrogenase subunit HndA